jgi:starch synthase
VHADAITTVSPTYANEIQTPELGFRLDGVFRERGTKLTGILNGVDYRIWDPRNDPLIASHYGKGDLSGKQSCKSDLQRYFGLELNARIPVIGMVTRLSTQKGLDLVLLALNDILARNCQLIVLGSGDGSIEATFRSLPARFPGQVGVEIGFSEPIAHKITAGCDFLLMPSRYEPCGLTQMYGLRYGTIPIVRATGGLKDSVDEFHPEHGHGNGFLFDAYEPAPLLAAVTRALSTYSNGGRPWEVLVANAMSADFSWARSAQGYLDVYRSLINHKPGSESGRRT